MYTLSAGRGLSHPDNDTAHPDSCVLISDCDRNKIANLKRLSFIQEHIYAVFRQMCGDPFKKSTVALSVHNRCFGIVYMDGLRIEIPAVHKEHRHQKVVQIPDQPEHEDQKSRGTYSPYHKQRPDNPCST